MEKDVLQKWENRHWQNVFEELKSAGIRLEQKNIEAIVEFMRFRVRSKRNPERCTRYKEAGPCHPEIEDLNCLLCSCPDYDSSTPEGACKAGSKKGFYYTSKTDKSWRVWDCTNCSSYHSPQAVTAYLKENIDKLRAMSENPTTLEFAFD